MKQIFTLLFLTVGMLFALTITPVSDSLARACFTWGAGSPSGGYSPRNKYNIVNCANKKRHVIYPIRKSGNKNPIGWYHKNSGLKYKSAYNLALRICGCR